MQSDISYVSQPATELEFYIPAAVWNHPATRAFLTELSEMVQGATVLGGATGIWKGEKETTNLVRMLLRTSDMQLQEILPGLQERIRKLMAAWCLPGNECQESFIFTVRELTVHEFRRHNAHAGDP